MTHLQVSKRRLEQVLRVLEFEKAQSDIGEVRWHTLAGQIEIIRDILSGRFAHVEEPKK
jgi:hypothetical protein